MNGSSQVFHPFITFCRWATGETLGSCWGCDLMEWKQPFFVFVVVPCLIIINNKIQLLKTHYLNIQEYKCRQKTTPDRGSLWREGQAEQALLKESWRRVKIPHLWGSECLGDAVDVSGETQGAVKDHTQTLNLREEVDTGTITIYWEVGKWRVLIGCQSGQVLIYFQFGIVMDKTSVTSWGVKKKRSTWFMAGAHQLRVTSKQ